MTYRMPRLVAGAALLLAASALLGGPSHARWARLTQPVPIERLVKNVNGYVRERPREARGYYVLGRLHSMAFAEEGAEIEVIPAGENRPENTADLPGFAGYQTIQVTRGDADKPLDARAVGHLRESVRNYRRATQLDRNDALAFLGLGWMLEQGARWSNTIDAPPGTSAPSRAGRKRLWEDQALAAYRRAHALTVEADRKRTGFGPGEDAAVSLEAGEGILRLLGTRRALSSAERADVARIRQTVAELGRKPRAITPLIFPLRGFPLRGTATLADLLAPERTVVFDLAGDGRAGRWPWVGPDTGILVWDPEGTGRITSGRQLFGSVTWWIFWKNGYAPLAALDDNRDGSLADEELGGLAVWRDRNGNGISEPGEVVPARAAGIAAISVRAAGTSAGVPANARGIRWADGAFSATYDWTPISR